MLVCLMSISTTASYDVTVTAESPSVKQSSAAFASLGIETFEAVTPGTYATYTSNFNGSGSIGSIQGTYYNLRVSGNGESGNYAYCESGFSYRLVLSRGVNYFGLWISSLNQFNRLEFRLQEAPIYALGTQDVMKILQYNLYYYGNPPMSTSLPSAFVNFFFLDSYVDEIKFIQLPGGGNFESDSQSVGIYTKIAGFTLPLPKVSTTTTTMPPTTKKPVPLPVVLGATAGFVCVVLSLVVGGIAAVSDVSTKAEPGTDLSKVEAPVDDTLDYSASQVIVVESRAHR